jgi:hypothetical protein
MIEAQDFTRLTGSPEGMSTMRLVRSLPITLIIGLALLIAVVGARAWSVAASAADPLPVTLGTHSFGNLRGPEAIVAKAGRDEVGWHLPQEGANYGPWAFDVAGDGSVWLLDEVKDRLLVWSPGQPGRPARSVTLPFRAADDFALGRNGTIYASSWPAGSGRQETLYALTLAGQVRWTAPLLGEVFGGSLLLGDDGVLYHDEWASTSGTQLQEGWAPVTTPAGAPLPVAEQRRRSSPNQPLPGGLRLATRWLPKHEVRFTLVDRAGKAVRAWQVTSRTDVGGVLGFTPSLVGGDPVVAVAVSRNTTTKFLYEYLVLRLAPTGGTRARVALDARATWGDTETPLRVGPDGKLYQLRSNPAVGVSIARYPLAPTQVTTTTTATATPSGGGAAAPTTVASPPATAPTVTTPAPTATTPPTVQAEPASRTVVPWLAALASSTLFALGAWLVYRHRKVLGRQRPPRPAH